jgi:hypothetical protein
MVGPRHDGARNCDLAYALTEPNRRQRAGDLAKPHAACDVEGVGNVPKAEHIRLAGASVRDPTDE